MLKKILYGLGILFVLLQFVRPDKNISEGKSANHIGNKYAVPANVEAILQKHVMTVTPTIRVTLGT